MFLSFAFLPAAAFISSVQLSERERSFHTYSAVEPSIKIEVKGDNKIDDAVVKAKQAADEEMAVASGVKYLMYAGSRITSSHILDDIPMEIQQDTLPLGS